eukprot:jgi/Tetstr1/448796/TSEL_036030.t1
MAPAPPRPRAGTPAAGLAGCSAFLAGGSGLLPSSTLSPGTSCVAARCLTALVLCLMMPPALFCCCASTPTKPWSFGDASVPAASGNNDTTLLFSLVA